MMAILTARPSVDDIVRVLSQRKDAKPRRRKELIGRATKFLSLALLLVLKCLETLRVLASSRLCVSFYKALEFGDEMLGTVG